MGQNGTNRDRVHTVSLGSMGETENWVENGENRKKQENLEKMCDRKLQKSNS